MELKAAVNIKNKKASFEYELLEKFIAGVQLVGTEIKSIRLGKASLVDSFCIFMKNELWIKGLHIAEYSLGSYNNHKPKRDRKLLLNRKELNKMERKIKEKGLTMVPTKFFINKKGLAKLEIALARGKKTFDKRESLKRKDAEREMKRDGSDRYR